MTDPHAQMALTNRLGAAPTSSRFYLSQQKRYFQALLDYVMVSPDLAASGTKFGVSGIRLMIRNVMACQNCAQALLAASDHFPVTIDLEL